MKKHLLILATLIVGAFSAKAQIINAGFESWQTDALVSTAMDPNGGNGSTGWWDFNFFNDATFFGSPATPVSVFRNSDTVYSGKYSALVESVVLNSTASADLKTYGFAYPDTAGLLMTGNINIGISGSTVKEGEPFKSRITNFPFYYQYYPNGVDTAYCEVVLSHFSGGKRNVLGAGMLKIMKTTSWTMGSVPIFYDSASGNPDTIVVVYDASTIYHKGIPKPGSKLYLDNADTVTGIRELNAPAIQINVYPNPASTEVNFVITGNDMAQRADIYDITGKKINTYSIMNNLAAISTVNYAPGLYFYQVYDKSGALMKTGKFSVSR